jgi:ATP-dependent Lhr-like helicase
MLRQPPHILITTPESLYLLLDTERGRDLFRELIIGGIDLVVHLEAPRSVSGTLQRVGGSGHLLSAGIWNREPI